MFQNFSIKQSYTVIFIILIFWASLAYYTMNSLIDAQSYYAKLINLSGKQRMLSQKSAFLVSKYMHQKDQHYKELLQDTIKELVQNHQYITKNLSLKAQKLYFEDPINLDQRFQIYIKNLQQFYQNGTIELEKEIFENSQTILTNLDQAVELFQKESETKTKDLQQRELYIFIGTILTILLEAHFFARPVIEKMKLKFKDFYEKLSEKDHLLQLQSKFFQNAHEGIVITNKFNDIIDLNPAFEKITGYKKEELLGKNPSILKSGEHYEDFYTTMWKQLLNNGFYQGEVINRKKDGDTYVQNVSIFVLKNDQGEISNYFALVSDITETFLTRKKMFELANYDPLTGIHNRYSFYEKLQFAIYEHQRNRKKFALVFVDLDDFKKINDTLGHDYGDSYLIEFTQKLQKSLRKNDILARIGGDEFIIILDGIEGVESVDHFFARLFQILDKPIQVRKNTHKVFASFGVSVYPEDAKESGDLVKYADLAMYESKKNGKNQYTFYNTKFEQQLLMEMKLEKDIHEGLGKKEFVMYLQPKIDIQSGQIAGVEMLIRWIKDGKMIFPDTFIPFCEKSNLIVDIGNEVLDQVFDLLKRWSTHEKFQNLKVSFNLSSKQIFDTTFIEKFEKHKEFLTSRSPILIAEITEHSIVEDFEHMEEFLYFLRNHNVQIALDDFGTGYSSLQYLKILPIDYLKVDKEFTLNIFQNPKDMAITKTIITLAKNLNLDLIVEGVETSSHVEFCKTNRCRYAQGYYYSKAISLVEFEEKYSS